MPGRAPPFALKMESVSLGATCTTVMSYFSLRSSLTAPESATGKKLRSMPITGVMPEPAVTNSSLDLSIGRTKSFVAGSRWISDPTIASRTM